MTNKIFAYSCELHHRCANHTMSNSKNTTKYEGISVSTPLCHYPLCPNCTHQNRSITHIVYEYLSFLFHLFQASLRCTRFPVHLYRHRITAPHSMDHLLITAEQTLRHLASKKSRANTSEMTAISRRICPKLTSVNHSVL